MLKYVNIIIHIESYMRVRVYIWQLTVLLWHIGFFFFTSILKFQINLNKQEKVHTSNISIQPFKKKWCFRMHELPSFTFKHFVFQWHQYNTLTCPSVVEFGDTKSGRPMKWLLFNHSIDNSIINKKFLVGGGHL